MDPEPLSEHEMKLATLISLRFGHMDRAYRRWRLGKDARYDSEFRGTPLEGYEFTEEENVMMRKIQNIAQRFGNPAQML